MLAPKRVLHRKVQRGSMKGQAKGNTELHFGKWGLVALERHWITNRQIEAGRVAIVRRMKRGGKIWITIFPDKPISKKPAETRMGKGKGNPEEWVAVVKPGRVMYEIDAPSCSVQDADQDQDHHPRRAGRGGVVNMKYKDIRELSDEELAQKLEDGRAELFNLRFQMATSQLDNTARVSVVKRDIARIQTEMRARQIAADNAAAQN